MMRGQGASLDREKTYTTNLEANHMANCLRHTTFTFAAVKHPAIPATAGIPVTSACLKLDSRKAWILRRPLRAPPFARRPPLQGDERLCRRGALVKRV